MEEIKLKIDCRIEEVSPIGRFLLDSMNAGLTDFNGYSPDYNAAYVANGLAKLAVIEALIHPKQFTAEMKLITGRVYGNMDALRGKIDFLEGYINRATGLTMGKKDFGIHEVRSANNRRDVEKLIDELEYLLTNVTNNFAALSAKGYTATQHTALSTIKTALYNDNAAQNTKINDRNNKVVANYGLINEFWAICTDISDAGKRIYKSIATNKVDDFTIAELKRRIRQEQRKNKFAGVVTLVPPTVPGQPQGDSTEQAGKVFANVKIEMIPVTGGRRRVTKSNAKGKFEIKSLTDGEYIANFTAKNAVSQSYSIKIETGKTTTLNVAMVDAGNETATKLK